jgi:sugar lactone lactonase YvrE
MTEIRRVVAGDDILGETPLWCDRTQALWWIDIDRARLQRFTPATGRHQIYPIAARYLGSLALRESGGFVVARDLGLYTYDPGTGALDLIVQVEPPELDARLNDGRCDRRGRLWVGSMDNQLHRPVGSFHRIDATGAVTTQFGAIIVSNTVAISPDDRVLYFSDTRRYVTWAFDLDIEDGRLSNRRVFVDHTAANDRPDGACIDAEGYVWTAIFAGSRVVRYTPDGRVDRVVPLPVTNPTCPCFGGADLRTLYITSARKFLSAERLAAEPWAGSLLAFDAGVRGLPEARFGG